MDGDGSTIAYCLVFVVLILLAAFFNASKSALIAFSDSRLKKLCEDGNPKAQKLQKMLKTPARYLETCDILGFLFAIGAVAVIVGTLFRALTAKLIFANYVSPVFHFLSSELGQLVLFILLILFLGFFLYLFAYALPKRLIEHKPEQFAFFCMGPLRFFRGLFFPFVWLLTAMSGGIAWLFGVKPGEEKEDATEEEIRMMVDVGNEKGVIEESQKDMINNVFEFDDRTAEDVMTHRTEIIAVSKEATIGDIVYYAINEGFSRIPVYEEDIDNITGIIYVKDLLCLIGCQSTNDFKIADFIRPVLYVPESNRCRELFQEFTEKKIHMAVVVDEYGGTAGIVTMEDLLESIVGNIQDEYDDEEIEIQKIDDNVYMMDGSADLEEVAEVLGIDVSENDDYDTLGGLITDILGRIPDDGETPAVSFQNVDFTVLEVEDRRIVKAKAVVKPPIELEKEE